MDKSVRKNFIYNLTYQILVLITPLIVAPYLSRVLGADGVGTYSYIESISSYFVLFATLGLTIFGQREISYVQEDREKRSVIFWETNVVKWFASLFCIVAYVAFSLAQRNWQLYLVLVFNLLAVAADISWFFQGLEEFGKIVFRNALFKLLNIIFIFAVVKSKADLIWYLFSTAFFLFANHVTYWIKIKKYVDKPIWRDLKPLRHLKTIFSLFVPTIAIQIYTVLDKTMIGVITKNAFENGYYEQAMKISKMVLMIVTSLGTVLIPRIGHYFEKGDMEQVRSYVYKGYRFVWFIGIPLCVTLTLVSSNFVPWFFGDGYDKVVPLIGLLSLLIIAIGLSNVTGIQYLIPTKRQNLLTQTVICGAVTNFVFNCWLINLFQSYGAAIASVIAETVVTVVQIYIVRKELSAREIIRSSSHYLLAGGAMAVTLLLVRGYFAPSVLNTIALSSCGVASYCLVLFVIRDKFFFDNIVSLGGKLCKRLFK